jgi:hypothetical protein
MTAGLLHLRSVLDQTLDRGGIRTGAVTDGIPFLRFGATFVRGDFLRTPVLETLALSPCEAFAFGLLPLDAVPDFLF